MRGSFCGRGNVLSQGGHHRTEFPAIFETFHPRALPGVATLTGGCLADHCISTIKEELEGKEIPNLGVKAAAARAVMI